MSEQSNAIPRPLIWVAGVALIAFCIAGLAAIMGWIPTSTGQTGSSSPPVAKSNAQASKPVRAPQSPSDSSSNRETPVVAAKCTNCGVIESVSESESRGEGTGLGVVGGAVVGGVLGNQVGGGRGKDVATVLGAVGGAVAGNEVERRARSSVSTNVTVRMDGGGTRVVREAGASSGWRAGDRVKIVDDRLQRI